MFFSPYVQCIMRCMDCSSPIKLIYSLNYPPTQSLTNLLTQRSSTSSDSPSLTRSFTQPLSPTLTHSLAQSLMHSCTHPHTHSHSRLLTLSLTHSLYVQTARDSSIFVTWQDVTAVCLQQWVRFRRNCEHTHTYARARPLAHTETKKSGLY